MSAILGLISRGHAAATAPADRPVRVTVRTDQVTRTLSPHWFGSGAEYFDGYFASATRSPAAVDAIRGFGLGFLRWPHGTCSLWYFWDAPHLSYNPMGNGVFLTPDQLLEASRAIGAEPVVQVNTYQFRAPRGDSFESARVLVAPGNIKQGAEYAARWVAHAKENGHRITWWEIGNEDWVYWSGKQYANIANVYARAMKQADPDIRILIQGFTGRWIGAFHTSEGEQWMEQLLDTIEVDLVDALSVHEYASGQLPGNPRPLAEETASMLARADHNHHLRSLRALLRERAPKWEMWLTEFNVKQDDPAGPGGLALFQNVAHGLVVADWVGQMLLDGVDRVGFHNLTGHPAFQFMDVGKWTTPDRPQFTVPGLALMAFARDFGNELLAVETEDNPPRLSATYPDREFRGPDMPLVSHEYAAVSAYAARRPEDGSIRIILINRDLERDVQVQLDLAGLSPDQMVEWRTLGADVPLDAGNVEQPQRVRWRTSTIPVSDLTDLRLARHSMNLLIVDR